MPETEPLTLIQRIRHHLRDERINTEDEVDAEINLMTNLELVEVISFCLCGMGAPRERMQRGLRPDGESQLVDS